MATRATASSYGRWAWLTAALTLTILAPSPAVGIFLQGTETSYARFPKWDACTNATFSFEFRTTQSEGLLMYADDGGRFDFFQMMHTGGRIRLILNIVNGRDGRVQIDVGRSVNDGHWHRVVIRRHRMETTLLVDGVSDSRSSFGSDFNFGNTESNSEIFIGGLPNEMHDNIHQLALPSALYKTRFRGSIRNVIYGNCTCQRTRGRMIEGVGVTVRPREACDVRDPCRRGCLCVSTDTEPTCDCTELKCVTDVVTHYSLPMDLLMGTTLFNPSGLDASAFGSPDMIPGVLGQAIRLDGRNSYVRVTGPGHRQECFGDLDKCSSGYTLALWVNFEKPSDREVVYLSNGGHSLQSHGVAMLYDKGNMEFRFRKKNGQEWRVKHDNVLPGRWYHVSVTWSESDGLSLYLNGELVNSEAKATMRPSTDVNSDENNEFMIGRPNDGTHVRDSVMLVDEFNFWSKHMTPKEMKNLGAIFGYDMPMESMRRSRFTDTKLSTRLHGNPVLAPGKIGSGLLLDGRGEYLDGGDLGGTCIGNLSRCQYGFTFGAWITFNELLDNMYYFSSGAPYGVKLYHRNGRLYAEAQQETSNWRASWSGVQTGKWYFVELSWSPDDGLRMFVDLDEVAHAQRPSTRRPTGDDSGRFILGRANTDMRRYRYGAAIFDEVEVWNSDRERLVRLGFISRGKPSSHIFHMDEIDRRGLRHRNASYNVRVFGDARIVPGKIAGGLRLDGNTQYVDADFHAGDCMGNLDLCRHGALASLWVKPAVISEKMQLISTGVNGLAVWYAGGRLHATAKTSTREWQASTDKYKPTQWAYMEFAWDPTSGLQIYINNERVATSGPPTVRSRSHLGYIRQPEMNRFYLGRGDGSDNDVNYANVTMDEMEYWHLNREELIAFDYILRGRPQTYLLDMNEVRNNKLTEPKSLDITTHGRPQVVPGKRDNAIELDGNGQYLDLGRHPKSCLGNLTECHHGTTGSMWANFKKFNQNTYYYTNGNGVAVYYKNDDLYYSFTSGDQRWEVAVPDLVANRWYFLEYTWHPEKGLRVYVNNRLLGTDSQPEKVTRMDSVTNHVYVGRANRDDVNGRNFRFPEAVLDEVETWYADRDYLVAFGYLTRDNITHVLMPLEHEQNGAIVYPDMTVRLYHGADIVRAKVGNGISVDGDRQYISLGDHGNDCFGNLEMCNNGLTMAFYLRLQRLVESGYIISAGPYSIYSKDGRVHFKYSTSTKTWETSTGKIKPGRWQKVMVSWDEDKGLQVFVDNSLVSSTTRYRLHTAETIRDSNVYIGRPNRVTPGRYGDFTIDELELWYANVDHLKAFNLIDQGIKHVWFDMDRIDGDRLPHDKWTIFIRGQPVTHPGIDGNAIYLNGRNQYIDFGRNMFCNGDPETSCSSGFTLSFEIEPRELREDTYFVSSAPVDVYYRNGRLTTDVKTPTKKWSVSTNRLDPNAWYKVDVSWHPKDGLQLYVNGVKVDERTTWTINRYYDENANFYFGRANTDMLDENYAHTLVDNIELWYARRQELVDRGLVKAYFVPPPPRTRRPQYTRPAPRTTPAPRFTYPVRVRTTEPPRPRAMPPFPPVVDDQRMLVYDGNSWVMYDYRNLSPHYLRGDKERFHIKFKTDKPEGLLWYSGTSQRNMHLSLEDAALILVVEYFDGRTNRKDRFRLRPAVGRLDDNRWHNVFINRDRQKVTLTVDGEEHDYPYQLDSRVRVVNKGYIYLGGSNNTYELTGQTTHTGIRGSVETATITGDGFPSEINFLNQYMVRPRPYYVHEGGNVRTRIIDRSASQPRPVTFINRESFVRLRKLDFGQNGRISLRFKTIEPNGLILFNGGRRGSSDFIAIEMFDGIVYFVINYGNGVHRYPLSAARADDGRAHHIQVQRSRDRITLSLDNVSMAHRTRPTRRAPPGDNHLDLATFLYIGGVENPSILPWHLWTRGRTAENFFVGCMWDLRVNPGDENDIVDLPAFIRSQGIAGMEEGCRSMREDCAVGPCVNGVCHDRATGYMCDCSATPYTSTRCNTLAKKVGFNGRDSVHVTFNPMIQTHTNDISLRFKTVRPDGLLFSTSNRFQHDFMRVSLEGGKGKLETYIAGEEKIHYFCDGLSDDEWHTMYIKRRADYIEAWVDDCSHVIGSLPGDGYTLDIHDIRVASLGRDTDYDRNFAGHMQNFMFDKYNLFELLGDNTPGSGVTVTTDIREEVDLSPGHETIIPVNTVTFRSGANAYVTLPTLSATGSLDFKFMFKTKAKEGLLFYNEGRESDFFALELVNGYVHLALNDGSGPRLVQLGSATQLNDDEWHLVSVKQTGSHYFEARVDNAAPTDINIRRSTNRLDLTGELYVGGVPQHMYKNLPTLVSSRNSFAGCLATIRVDGRLYNIFTDTITTNRFVTDQCTGASLYCGDNTCSRYGACHEGFDTFFCDCNMTSFVGRICTEEAEGYRFARTTYKNGTVQRGVVIYTYDEPLDTSTDKLAFGFMTWKANGTIFRADSAISADYIEGKLENGYLVMVYDIGNGERRLVEKGRKFDDGQYHYVSFVRTGANATMRVDDFPRQYYKQPGTAVRLFNELAVVKVGGKVNVNNKIYDYFDGIIAGVYFNGERIIDRGIANDVRVVKKGDVTIATHKFHLPPPIIVNPTKEVVVAPMPKPEDPKPIVPDPVVNVGGATGGGTGDGGAGKPGGGGIIGGGASAARVQAAGGPSGGSGEGARAGAIAGAFLGILAAASGIMWAGYKLKPGLLGGGGGGGGGGGKGAMNISSPSAGSYQLVSTGGGAGGAGGGAGGGAARAGAGGASYSNVAVTRMDAMNGATTTGLGFGAAGNRMSTMGTQTAGASAGGGGASSANFVEYFSSMSAMSAAGGGGSGIANYIGGVGRITRAAQTDLPYYGGTLATGYLTEAMAMNAGASGGMLSSTTTSYYQQDAAAARGGGYGTMDNQTIVVDELPPPTLTRGMTAYESQTMAAGGSYVAPAPAPVPSGYNTFAGGAETMYSFNESQGYGSAGGSVSSAANAASLRMQNLSPVMFDSSAASYTMQNVALNNAAYNQRVSMHGGTPVGLMAAEEIRVDCVLLSADSRNVITSSIYGPPQVWDMRTGELTHIMAGENLSSTDLHLACNDTLLVGQVAEMTQIDPNDTMATNRLHHRKLQIWDFATGQPLEMSHAESCTASCLMHDGQRIVLARTEKFGNGTTIVLWDLLGNELIRQLSYDSAIGFADAVSYLTISKDNRYVVAGFQNSYDGNANFIVFDLSRDPRARVDAKILALEANVDCTAVLDNHEAVTGTRKGELTIWSMRTGKQLRQLVAPPSGYSTLQRSGRTPPATMANAHAGEVKAVQISRDGKFLVSASADTTLKIWNLETEKLSSTLKGHTDEVWCCTISSDDDMVVSGSRDGTIRLWKSAGGQLTSLFNAGVDIFSVRLSSDKRTIVALGDKFAARKLVMLQIVHTRTKGGGSRATSPLPVHY